MPARDYAKSDDEGASLKTAADRQVCLHILASPTRSELPYFARVTIHDSLGQILDETCAGS
jgi:hypothetical protein